MAFIGSVMFILMLLNGRRYADWISHHAGMPARLMVPLLEDSASAIRGYAWGTTIVATANAVPIGLAAWLFGLPLVGAITIVTFVTAYIPYFGAIFASIFVCFLALGAAGLPTALAMLVIILLVNNVLQNVLAPVAYGATLQARPAGRAARDDRCRSGRRHHPDRAGGSADRDHRPGRRTDRAASAAGDHPRGMSPIRALRV